MCDLSILSANPDFAKRNFHGDLAKNDIKDKFSQDRDRILYSKEFRRLSGKTQVFVVGFDDNMRNRLTHTLEVAQIAKTISNYFKLNLTLTEAIAYAHDVGHTPFGHIGERTLNFITNGCETFYNHHIIDNTHKGFKHNFQGIKVTSKLEKISRGYDGLNLTDMTLWGILNHTDKEYKPCAHYNADKTCSFRQKNTLCNFPYDGCQSLSFYHKYLNLINDSSFTIEAIVVRMADEIAQRHHDIEDGILAKIISKSELADLLYSKFSRILSPQQKTKITKLKNKSSNKEFIHDFSNLVIDFYVNQLISSVTQKLIPIIERYNIASAIDWQEKKILISKQEDIFKLVDFSDEFKLCDIEIRNFLKLRILNSHLAQTMDSKANFIIRNIFKALISNPTQLPDNTIITLFNNLYSKKEFENVYKNKSEKSLAGIFRLELIELQNSSGNKNYQPYLIRTITDYIAGTTDLYALDIYKKMYGFESIKYL